MRITNEKIKYQEIFGIIYYYYHFFLNIFHYSTTHVDSAFRGRTSHRFYFSFPTHLSLKFYKRSDDLPASSIRCLTLCCLPCQNCHALISSSGLFSSLNINMTTLCKQKRICQFSISPTIILRSDVYLAANNIICVIHQ